MDTPLLILPNLTFFTGFEQIKIGVGYMLDGKPLNHMPSSLEVFAKVTVVYETVPGWKEDISKARSLSELPVAAQNYIKRIEQLCGVPVRYIGVGAGREDIILN